MRRAFLGAYCALRKLVSPGLDAVSTSLFATGFGPEIEAAAIELASREAFPFVRVRAYGDKVWFEPAANSLQAPR